mmetsp:Transcript_19683/g.19781  ORF Transcript_19683/g.19781 Transcript_19683/m.19781 type:complete len:285 (+) Transcript_19683:263-1117(+)
MERFATTIPRSFKRKLSSSSNISLQTFPKKNKIQMYIDLGQKSFDRKTQCHHCQMLYTVGHPDDEMRHKNFCKRNKEIRFTSLKTLHILDTSPSDSSSIIQMSVNPQTHHYHKALSIIARLKAELGCTQTLESPTMKMYVYVRELTVVGCVMVDQIRQKDTVPLRICDSLSDVFVSSKPGRSRDSAGGEDQALCLSSRHGNTSTVASSSQSQLEQGSLLGVLLVWTHETSRLEGIARRLLDWARKSYCFSTVYSQDQIAFSQPTLTGQKFAFAYTGSDEIRVFS